MEGARQSTYTSTTTTRRVLVVSLPAPAHQNPRARSAADHGDGGPQAESVGRRTRNRRQDAPAAIAVLHQDVLIWEILARLPPAAVLRCRAVWRAWRGITSDPAFLVAHNRRQPSLPLFVLRESSTDPANPERGGRPLLGLDYRVHGCLAGFTLHASCDGLLLLTSNRRRFSICNPLTRQHAKVPGLAGCFRIDALYLHRPSGEYRVLYWHHKNETNKGHSVCYVLTVPRARKPRRVAVPEDCRDTPDYYYPIPRPSVMLGGCLHWVPSRRPLPGTVVVFDTVAESFRSMRLPAAVAAAAATAAASSCATRLHDMEGLLGLSCFDDKRRAVVKVWVLEDYEREAWSLKYKVDFSPETSRHLVLSHGGDMLLYDKCTPGSYMVYYDGKFVEEFQWGSWGSYLTAHLFKESLVKHAFFPEPCSAPTVRHPCLFTRRL